MKVYGVYLSHYVYEVAWFKDLVKVFANENDANTYMDEMNKMAKEITDNIMDANLSCAECNSSNYHYCEICKYNPYEYSEEFEITFANGDTEQIDCNPNTYGGHPEFFVKEIEVN